jgi:hypothetical protein
LKKINLKILHNKLRIIIIALLLGVNYSYGQPTLPTRSVEASAVQLLQFGTFAVVDAMGGSVSVGWDGTRTAIGNITLLDISPYAQPAIFEVKLLQGRNIHIDFSPTATLYGSDGGSLTLNIGPTEKGINGAYFPTNNNREFITTLRVGGTLDIPSTPIPGTYTGTFFITFNQE